jgi:hypothetical protein
MFRWKTHRSPLALACCLVAILAVGCSDDSATRSVLLLESINSNETLNSDLYNNGEDGQPGTEDDFITEDQVSVLIRNRPHDPGLNVEPNGSFGAVVLNRYEINFTGPETPDPITGAMHLRIPSGATGLGEITVIPAAHKQVPPLYTILDQSGELLLTAEITIFGTEDDSNDEVSVSGTLPVHVADWADD